MKYVVGVDAQFVRYALRNANWDSHVPYRELVNFLEENGDEVLDIFAPAIRMPPTGATAEDIARSYEGFIRYSEALRQQGVHVIEAPAKRNAEGGVKHSDDNRLMIRLALACMRLRPDFLVLIAADGDYAPLVWGLREEGIRTKLITDPAALASDLRAAVYSISNIFNVLGTLGGGPVEAPAETSV
ncbi:MAG: NYN domain-containing protein [Methylobacteriaceae bacterium]|nr:NYN domain-containing protein [Methylobacteriaceae bacterium]